MTRNYEFYYFYTTTFCFFPLKMLKIHFARPLKILKAGGGADGKFRFYFIFVPFLIPKTFF